MAQVKYRLAPQGVYRSFQGEGALAGQPTIFVRLAGCSINCPGCDTNFSPTSEATAAQVAGMIARLHWGRVEWAWVTGGEPTDQPLEELFGVIRSRGLKVALATAGTREVARGWSGGPDFLSVSPHSVDHWVQRSGDQLNIVPGLNGLRIDAGLIAAVDACEGNFTHRYCTPLADREGRLVNLRECEMFVNRRAWWRLGFQAHKLWGVP